MIVDNKPQFLSVKDILIYDTHHTRDILEWQLRIRLDEVKRRLRQTNDPIAEITAACGWGNPTPPKGLFKKKFGMSMRDYRAQNSQR